MARRRTLLQALPGAALVALTGPAIGAPELPPRIVATFSILADMVRELAPAAFEVTALVGTNADAHVFEPSPADARRLSQAVLVVANGLGFEGWMERLVRASGYRGTVLVASQGLQPRHGSAHGLHKHGGRHEHAGAADPHAWQDLRNAQRYVRNIGAALSRQWPAQAGQVQARMQDYLARIEQLDRQVRQWLAPVPRAQRRVIASHDAFGYFGDAYGVDFLAPQGWNTAAEPSAAAVARLIRQIREQSVRALFVENISDPRLVQRVAAETGARIGGTLYSDALSAPDGPAASYLALFEHNARTLARALGAEWHPAGALEGQTR